MPHGAGLLIFVTICILGENNGRRSENRKC